MARDDGQLYDQGKADAKAKKPRDKAMTYAVHSMYHHGYDTEMEAQGLRKNQSHTNSTFVNMSVVYSRDPFDITEEGGLFVLYKSGKRVKDFPTLEKAKSAVGHQNSAAFLNGRAKAKAELGIQD